MLRSETAVDAVELFDRASLRECESDEDMARLVPDLKGADPMAAALLIECRGQVRKGWRAGHGVRSEGMGAQTGEGGKGGARRCESVGVMRTGAQHQGF